MKCQWLLKAVSAGLVSVIIVSAFCYFYYNLPSRRVVSTGSTDYSWSANNRAYRGTEGFAYTKTDENGYVNTFPEKKDTIDVLVMGSSHTEGFNVDYDENYTYLLNKTFSENGNDKYAYSIGVSGHSMVRCFRNLNSAINEFSPTAYVVLETNTIQPNYAELKALAEGTLEYIPAYSSKWADLLQKSDFLRLAGAQISNFMEQNKTANAVEEPAVDQAEYVAYLENMLKNGSEVVKEKGLKLMIVFSTPLQFDYDGALLAPQNPESVALFRSLCEKYDIQFVYMTPVYEEHYNATQQLVHGFSNTAVGKGHLNKYGHACVATEVYRYLMEGEKK